MLLARCKSAKKDEWHLYQPHKMDALNHVSLLCVGLSITGVHAYGIISYELQID